MRVAAQDVVGQLRAKRLEPHEESPLVKVNRIVFTVRAVGYAGPDGIEILATAGLAPYRPRRKMLT